MNNCFLFHLNALFILKIIKFLFSLRKTTKQFMLSQPGYETNKKHMLPNISRNKGNQTMKFYQLIE